MDANSEAEAMVNKIFLEQGRRAVLDRDFEFSMPPHVVQNQSSFRHSVGEGDTAARAVVDHIFGKERVRAALDGHVVPLIMEQMVVVQPAARPAVGDDHAEARRCPHRRSHVVNKVALDERVRARLKGDVVLQVAEYIMLFVTKTSFEGLRHKRPALRQSRRMLPVTSAAAP